MNVKQLQAHIQSLHEQATKDYIAAVDVSDNTDVRDVRGSLAAHDASKARGRMVAYEQVLNMIAAGKEVQP